MARTASDEHCGDLATRLQVGPFSSQICGRHLYRDSWTIHVALLCSYPPPVFGGCLPGTIIMKVATLIIYTCFCCYCLQTCARSTMLAMFVEAIFQDHFYQCHQTKHFADSIHIWSVVDTFTVIVEPFTYLLYQTVSTFDFHNLSHLAFSAAPNPPMLTVIPLYSASGGLLEIESQATERVS